MGPSGAGPRGFGRRAIVSTAVLAAIAFAVAGAGVILFQICLALGAPWGAYAMGGANPGRFPPALRVAAAAQALVIALLVVVVLSDADLVLPALADEFGWLIWLAIGFSAVSVVLNAITRSPVERRLWLPVTTVMLLSSLLVALA
jgi:hypothetical protein